MNKKIFIIFNLIMFILCIFFLEAFNTKASSNTIYIDPGHGGMDGGCITSSGVHEKEIVLNFALRCIMCLIGLRKQASALLDLVRTSLLPIAGQLQYLFGGK